MKSRLTKAERENLLIDLVTSLTITRSLNDVVLFLQDLLTKSEIEMLSKRLRIAKLLLSGMTYDEIADSLHTSLATVAKISAWLSERGDGFRNIIQKLPEPKEREMLTGPLDWDNLKRKYSQYFWPEVLLEEVVKSASKRQKDKIKNALDVLDEKNELHKRIEKLIRSNIA